MKYIIIILFLNPYTLSAQTQNSGKDSTAFLDSIFREMDEVLDHLVPAKSYLTVTAGAATGFYNFRSSSTTFSMQKRLLISPALSYIHKSGLSISTSGYIVADGSGLLPYQASFSPSYDKVKRGRWAAGTAYTKYFTRKNLSFYTTPISNDIYGYFNYRGWWLQPSMGVSFGWGSRKQLQQKQVDLLRLRKRRIGGTINTYSEETISDFSGVFSLRHHFSFSGLFHKKDLITLTPVAALNAGTQNYGFNTSYQTENTALNKFLPGNQYISDHRAFDFQSASAVMKLDYGIGMFFLQSQFLVDYYLHPAERRLNNAVSLVAGINL